VSLYIHFLLSREAYSHVLKQSFELLWQRHVCLPWLTGSSTQVFKLSFHLILHIPRGSAGNADSGNRQHQKVHKSQVPGKLGD
jgi:hypothetical protein